MRRNQLYNKLLGNDYVFSVLTKLFSVFVGIFHAAFLARFLGPELKGVSASITSIVSVGCILVTCGIHQAFPYYRKKDSSKNFLNKFCSTTLIVYSVLFVLAGIISFLIPAGIVIRVSILLIPVFGYETIINYVFLIEHPKKRNLTNLISSIAETIVLLLFWVLLKPNNFLMIICISIAIIIRAIASTVCVKFRFTYKELSFGYLWELLKFGWIPMIALLLTMLNSRLDIIMLNGFTFISAYQVGIYSTGVGLADKALFIPDAIREILLGKLVSGKEEDEVAKACRLGVFISTLITVFILVFGKLVIRVLFGDEYLTAYSIAIVCTLGTVFMVFIKMISQYNIVHKKQLTNMFLLAGAVVLNVLLNLWLVPFCGVLGTAIASLVSHFICGMSFVLFFSVKTKTRILDLIFVRKDDLRIISNFIKNTYKSN
ncbi:MAG: oligosaccharide flippase family protein [Clostridia bacterium]|nr:oligosaccharide flippase family protein [Clostridia bacterium]